MNDKPHVEYRWAIFADHAAGFLREMFVLKSVAANALAEYRNKYPEHFVDARVVRVRVEEVREEGQ